MNYRCHSKGSYHGPSQFCGLGQIARSSRCDLSLSACAIVWDTHFVFTENDGFSGSSGHGCIYGIKKFLSRLLMFVSSNHVHVTQSITSRYNGRLET